MRDDTYLLYVPYLVTYLLPYTTPFLVFVTNKTLFDWVRQVGKCECRCKCKCLLRILLARDVQPYMPVSIVGFSLYATYTLLAPAVARISKDQG